MATKVQLDLSSVVATELIGEAVGQVLNSGGCDEQLKRELLQWRDGAPQAQGRKQDVPQYYYPAESIPFELLFRVYQQLKLHPLG